MARCNKNSLQEIELKLVFPPEARPLIDKHPTLQDGITPTREQHLVTTYYDTPDFALSGNGLALGVRETGDQRLQTLKVLNDGQGPASFRTTWAWPVGADKPETGVLAETPISELGPELTRHLEPVLVSDVRRTIRRVERDSAIIDVTVDEGRIQAAGTEEPVRELELELKEGPLGPLYHLALELSAELSLRIDAETKAARARRLRTGQPPAAQKAVASDLRRKITMAESSRQIIACELGGLLRNQPAAEFGDAEGVHQMRVAIRRLRTALKLFEPDLEPQATMRFDSELQRLGRVLGEARDWDVFCLETLPTALAASESESWQLLLSQAASAKRTAARRALREELARPALTNLAIGLAVWAEEGLHMPGRTGARRLSERAPKLLDRVAKTVHRRGRRLTHLSPEELHRLRKSLKKLRYSADYMAGLYPHKAVKAYLKPCKHLQELLGEINDSAAAMLLMDELGSESADLVPSLSAVAQWSEGRRRKALQCLPDAWNKFRDTEPFWR